MTGVVEPLRLRVLAEETSLGAVRRTLRAWLAEHGTERADDVVLAVNEAVANAVEHAGLPRGGVVTVDADVLDDHVRVRVRDHGAWRVAASDETRGRGLVIMRAVMDRVDLTSEDGATSVVMSRRLR